MILVPAADQDTVDQLCVDLAKITIELADLNVVDIDARNVKARAIGRVRSIKERLSQIGIRHSYARGCPIG